MIGESIVMDFRHADTYLIRVSPQLHHVDDTVNKFLTYYNGRAAAKWEDYKGAWGVMDTPDAHLFSPKESMWRER